MEFDVIRLDQTTELVNENVLAVLEHRTHQYVATQNEDGSVFVHTCDHGGLKVKVTRAMRDETLVNIVLNILLHAREAMPVTEDINHKVRPRGIINSKLVGDEWEFTFAATDSLPDNGSYVYRVPDRQTADAIEKFAYVLDHPTPPMLRALVEQHPQFVPSGSSSNGAGLLTTSADNLTPAILRRVEWREFISPVRYTIACGSLRGAQVFELDGALHTRLEVNAAIIVDPAADDMCYFSRTLAEQITVLLVETYQTIGQTSGLTELVGETVFNKVVGSDQSGDDIIITGKILGVTPNAVTVEAPVAFSVGQKLADPFGNKHCADVVSTLPEGIDVILPHSEKRGSLASLKGKKLKFITWNGIRVKAWVGKHVLLPQQQHGWGQSSWAIKKPRLLCNSSSTGVSLTLGAIVECLNLKGLDAYSLFEIDEQVRAEASEALTAINAWLDTVPKRYPATWPNHNGRWTGMVARAVGVWHLVPKAQFDKMKATNWLPDHDHTVQVEVPFHLFEYSDTELNESPLVDSFRIPKLCDTFAELKVPSNRFGETVIETVYRVPSYVYTMWMIQQTHGKGQSFWLQKFRTALLLLLGKNGLAHNLLSPRAKGGWLTALVHNNNPDVAYAPLCALLDLGIQPGDWVVIGRMPTTDGEELAAVRLFPSPEDTPHLRVHWQLLDVAFKGDCDGDSLYLLKLRDQKLATKIDCLVPSKRGFGSLAPKIGTPSLETTTARFEFLSQTSPLDWACALLDAKSSVGTLDRIQFVLYQVAKELGLDASKIFADIGLVKADAINKYSTASLEERLAPAGANLHISTEDMTRCLKARFERFEIKGSVRAWYNLEKGYDWGKLSEDAKNRWLIRKLFLSSRLSLVSTRKQFDLTPLEWILQLKVLKDLCS